MEPKKSAEEMELDREEQQLRDEAASIDPVRPDDAHAFDDAHPADARAAAREAHPSTRGDGSGSQPKPDVTGTAKPDASKANDKAAQPNPDDAAKAPDPKATIQPTPFQKERARLNDSWKKLEAEKEAIRQEREQIAAERRNHAAQPAQRPTPAAAKPLIDGGDAATWDQIAREFEAEGNLPLAKRAKENAEKLHQQEQAMTAAAASSAPRERFTPEEVKAMQIEWQGHLQRLVTENPDLAKETSPMRKRVSELLQQRPALHMRGDGIVLAVDYVKAEMKAAEVEGLQKKLAELEAEKKRLESLTALPSGGATPQTGTRKFDDLSLDEQEAALREEAAA